MTIVIRGADELVDFATEHFTNHTTLITLNRRDVVQANFLAVIDGIEPEFETKNMSDIDAELLSPDAWDEYCTAIVVHGEFIEAVEAEAGGFVTLARLIVENPWKLMGTYAGGKLTVSDGGEYTLLLQRLREPIARGVDRAIWDVIDEFD